MVKEQLGIAFAAKMVINYCKVSLCHHTFLTVMAAMSVANIVKTSLGPVGLDKMLVDDVGVRYSSRHYSVAFYCDWFKGCDSD